MQLAWDNCQTHAPTQLSTSLKGILPVNTVAIVGLNQIIIHGIHFLKIKLILEKQQRA